MNVAELVHIAPRSLARRLSVWNTSISEELSRAKIVYAKETLEGSDLSIQEIATNPGYSNPSHFVRASVEKEDISPKLYRSRHRV